MMRKISLLLLGAVLGAGTVTIGSQSHLFSDDSARAASSDTYRYLNLFGDVFEKIRDDYVDKPNDQKLIQAAINGMMTSLDPHSNYMDAKEFNDMQVQTRGEFGGLGIEVTEQDGYIKVISPIDDTPAARAGIMSGDLISAIDGKSVKGLSLNQAVDRMRGQVGTDVDLTILRGPKKQPKDVKLTRAIIQIKSVKYKIEHDDVGYIRITQFNEQTFDGVKEAVDDFKKKIPESKFKGYILDLRNNPGGLLDQAVEVANVFIKHGEIVSTRGRDANETQRFNARPGGDFSVNKPMVVMINGGSASASEIVAGALQDHKRATLIGTRSFGKGSVQTIIPLGQGNGALRLTTARYYTPSGRSIQAKGIEPDIKILEDVPPGLKDKGIAEGEASLKGHLKNGPDEEKGGSQAYVPMDAKKDKQLIAAVEILNGDYKPAAEQAADHSASDSSKQPNPSVPFAGQSSAPSVKKPDAPK